MSSRRARSSRSSLTQDTCGCVTIKSWLACYSRRPWGGVDLIYVDEQTAGLLFPACTQRLQLGRREAPVPRAEHLAAMKVQAMLNDPSRLMQDLADVQHLLRIPGTDRAEARGYFERAGLTEWHDKLLATL
jgi:hypothetical protein